MQAGGFGGAALAVAWTLLARPADPAPGFFGAGALMLAGGIATLRAALARRAGRLTAAELGIRNAARRPGRSLATAGALACGCFVVLSVSAMKQELTERSPGAGGFELYGESTVPVASAVAPPEGASITTLRMREGDDASCLNLNAAPAPTLLGVDPAALAPFAGADTWKLLEREFPDGAVPALVGDAATAPWKLRMKTGPEDGGAIEYRDERGTPFKVRLVGALPARLTVFQGRLLIADREFTRRFPSEGGARVFLVDVPAGHEDRVAAALASKLETAGLDVVRSADRLKEFYAVESAYLGMFLALGGLGVLLGTAGMGILTARNVMERRGELALLQAVGWTKARAAAMVGAEHRFLTAAGLAAGTAAALVPSLARPGASAPFAFLGAFLLGTAALSLLWIRLATALALRGPILPALREE